MAMICPRCDRNQASVFFEPEDKSWVIFHCATCGFMWRSTEETSVKDPKRYDSKFKLDPEKFRL